MSIKAIGLDWSGVVSNDMIPVHEANMRIFEQYGRQRITIKEWLSNPSRNSSGFMISMGIIEPKGTEYLEYLYREKFNEVIGEGIVPEAYSDAFDVLRYLHKQGIPIAVVSCHPEYNLRQEAEKYDLSEFIQTMIGGSGEKTENILRICKELGVNPIDLLYVGDTEFDIESGKSAGTRTAGVPTGYQTRSDLEKAGPDYILDSLSELRAIF